MNAADANIEMLANQYLEWTSINGGRGRPYGALAELCRIIHAVADPICAEIDAMKARYQPGHTDLMVSPESLDAWLEDNPLPAEPASAWRPMSTAAHVESPSVDLLVRDKHPLNADKTITYRITDAWFDPDKKVWYQPRAEWGEAGRVTGEILGWMPMPDLTPPEAT